MLPAGLPVPAAAATGSWLDRVNISSNGQLDFVTPDAAFTNSCLPDASTSVVIFPYWDDLRTDTGGSGVFSHVTGTAPNRTYYLEWRATYFADGGQAQRPVGPRSRGRPGLT